MIVLMLVAVGITALVLTAQGRDGDLPQRLVAAATNRLPADRQPWGQALVAELAAIRGRRPRWRFAAATVRIALLPPSRTPATARTTAVIGAAFAVAATLVAVRLLPTLSVFVAALCVLTSLYATAIAGRMRPPPIGRARLAAAVMAVTGVLAATASVGSVAVIHPPATHDPTHIFSLVLAAALCCYLITGLSATTSGTATRQTVWIGLAGAGVAVAASATPIPVRAVLTPISPITTAATVATTLIVGAVTRSRAAATRAGLITAVLSTPIEFAIAVAVAQHNVPSTLTNSYDIAAYPHSGYPDVASYLLSDTIAGGVVSLAVTPLTMYGLAAVAAAVASRLRGGGPSAMTRRDLIHD